MDTFFSPSLSYLFFKASKYVLPPSSKNCLHAKSLVFYHSFGVIAVTSKVTDQFWGHDSVSNVSSDKQDNYVWPFLENWVGSLSAPSPNSLNIIFVIINPFLTSFDDHWHILRSNSCYIFQELSFDMPLVFFKTPSISEQL